MSPTSRDGSSSQEENQIQIRRKGKRESDVKKRREPRQEGRRYIVPLRLIILHQRVICWGISLKLKPKISLECSNVSSANSAVQSRTLLKQLLSCSAAGRAFAVPFNNGGYHYIPRVPTSQGHCFSSCSSQENHAPTRFSLLLRCFRK